MSQVPVWATVLMTVAVVSLAALTPLALATPDPPGFDAPALPTEVIAGPEPISVAFLGDSYAAGTGTDNASKSFAQIGAQALGWSPIDVFAVGGTGYTSPLDINYQSRVADVIAVQPDVVVVNGTRNDSGKAAEVQPLAAQVFGTIRAALPDAQLIVIGPIWTSDDIPQDLDLLNDAIRAAAAANSAVFLDALHPSWLPGLPGQIAGDGIHPTEAGHRVIASAFEEAVRTQLPDLVRR